MTTQSKVAVQTLAQFAQSDDWSASLLHPQQGHLLIWITRGQGVVTLNGVRRGFGPHNAIFIPKGKIWSIDVGRQSLGLVVHMPEGVSDQFPTDCAQLRIQSGLDQSELTSLIEDMRREAQQARSYVQDALRVQSQLLAIWLQRQIEIAPAAPRPKAAQRLVLRFCDLASHEYQSGLSMADFAKRLDVTPTHLTRVCREVCGKTAADILAQCVLHTARAELAHSNRSIKDVAAGLGFNSAAYFTRFIQHHCRTTPSALRRDAQSASAFRTAA